VEKAPPSVHDFVGERYCALLVFFGGFYLTIFTDRWVPEELTLILIFLALLVEVLTFWALKAQRELRRTSLAEAQSSRKRIAVQGDLDVLVAKCQDALLRVGTRIRSVSAGGNVITLEGGNAAPDHLVSVTITRDDRGTDMYSVKVESKRVASASSRGKNQATVRRFLELVVGVKLFQPAEVGPAASSAATSDKTANTGAEEETQIE
jgi:hypothetical protein